MSPTRRDVLTSFAVATIAVALPKRALAAPDTLDTDTTVDDAIYDHLLSFAALSDRIHAEHQEIQKRLVRHANRAGVELEHEAPGQYVARQPDRPGECELVTWNTCTCHRYRVWHRCEHVALVRRLHVEEQGHA